MLPLKYGGLWMSLGGVLVVAVMAGSLLPGPDMARFVIHDKFVHFGSYFLLMAWFSGMYRRIRDYSVIAAVLISLGLALDLLQGLTATRYFDSYDIAANVVGTATGFVLAIVLIGGWCGRVEKLLSR